MLKRPPHLTLMGFTLLLGACAGTHDKPGAVADSELRSAPETLVYECDDYAFTARLGQDEMAVWLEDGYWVLERQRSGSGMKYAQGHVQFFGKGDDGILTISGRDYRNCKQVPNAGPWEDARRRGVSFRAVGNEPGWHLEIQPDKHLLFVGDYGMQRSSTPWVAPQQVEGDITRYHAVTEASDLTVDITNKTCQDTMKGEVFPSSVTVTLNGSSYQGCGRPLDYPWQ